MNVLLTNDDGVFSDGINELAVFLKDYYDVVVVAPDRERSAVGHAITMHKPLRIKKIKDDDRLKIFYANGTPSDCVKLGIDVVMDKKPDIIISGINDGFNLGTDVLYSGTVSAAMEGAINGYPSVAISLEAESKLSDKAMLYIRKLIDNVARNGLPKNCLLNVNIPNVSDEFNGIKITKLGQRNYTENFTKRIDPRGRDYYWLAGKVLENANDEDSDIIAVKNGFISITPIQLDLTMYSFIDNLKNWDMSI
ncbi:MULTISPECIES: 5'/3'-nucleotidase SurE [Thermoanaerobacterium]|uniref:5'-nucleotidase SurE n=2 Tax=Thermoanaerobacterium TaxID=28895 RepID=W9EE63_9THEO|nr:MULTISPECIES: 5'/3'-nucleotidase SurE [Thermoanaerobacterium]AFK86886.1 Survival protein SurE-like phosphatase/nucleotidase [Thermoanaerobacterium saccharolyticum JW/SL-YS485]ETO39305.1 Survival protein SurE-like phosphatase/nucleotidase [Thermoanaerobacterium aotearoense SCUT27]